MALGLAPLGSFGRAGSARYANAFGEPELTPEDEQGLLRSAVDVGLSGLAKAGNILDLPGSSIRDILSGENPFDQWAPWNWTSGQSRTSPEDMLQRFGVLTPQFRKQHPILSFLGGTAAAIATDPLTYTGLPGVSRLSQAGKVAQRSGLLKHLDSFLEPGMGRGVGRMTRTLGDITPTQAEINQLRAGGFVREADDAAAKLLSAENAATKMGTTVDALRGEVLGSRNMLPESIGLPLAGALDTAGAAIGRTAPARALRAAFDASAGGFFPEFRQKIASVRHALLPGARRDARYKAIELAEEAKTIVDGFRQAFGTAGFADDDIARFADDAIRFSEEFLGKQTPRPTEYAEGIQMVREAAEQRMGLAPGTLGSVGQQLPMETETLNFAKKIADLNTATRDHLVNMGGKIGWIETYAPRFLDQPAIQSLKLEALRGGRVMGTVGPSQIGRSPEIADLYTRVVNTMLTDTNVRKFTAPPAGSAAKQVADIPATAAEVRASYGQWLDNQYGAADELKDIAKMPEVTPAEKAAKAAAIAQSEAKSLERHSKALAKWLHQHEKPQELFTRETLRDQLDSMLGQFKVNKTAEAIHETFKQFAEDFSGAGVPNPVSWKPTFRNGRWGLRAVTKSWRSDEWMTLDKAFETAGLDKDKALEYFARKFGLATPKVAPGYVRFYHGGNKYSGGTRWLTEDVAYAKGYAMKNAGSFVHYVDIPETHPVLQQVGKAFDDTGLPQRAPYNPFDAPEEIASQLKSFDDTGLDRASKMLVPANLANATAGMMEASTNTEFQSLIGEAIDTMNRMFKVGVTAHPANWIRNWYSGQFVNLAASGEIAGPADIASYVKHAGQAWNQRQDEKLIREMLLEGVIDPAFGSEGVEFTGALSKDPRLLNQSPLGFRDSLATARTDVAGWTKASEMGEAVAGLPNDALAAQGAALDRRVKQIQTAWQTGVNTSAKANNLVEWNNRVPMYLYLKSKGFSPAEAAERVRFLQLDYRNGLSGFEKTYMRRLAPFYSFSRLAAPVILKTLKDRPGGVMAQMIKASSRMGGRDAMTPEYVSEGLSVPLGTTPEGDVRYFSATGMPYEDLFAFFGGRSLSRTMGLEAMSRATPYLKGPAEWVTGRSFFQQGPSGGRDITDLDPVLGRTVSNATQYIRWLAGDKDALSKRPLPARFPAALEQLVSNSPLSRYATSTRTLLDPRKNPLEKAVNLLSGAMVTTISPQARLAMMQERLGVLGKEQFGGRDMSIFYVPEKELERMRLTDPEKYQQALKFKALQAVVNRERSDLRKEAKAGPVNQGNYEWAFR